MSSLRVLVIEDNQALVANIFDYLEPLGYIMDTAPNGVSGLHLVGANNYDAIVLDIMLPRMDGWEVCRRIRQEMRLDTPVIMLTAKDSLSDKLSGFKSGADDYLIKPFALPELEARLNALTRRGGAPMRIERLLQVGELYYDMDTCEASKRGQKITLNPSCRRMLEILMRESPRIVPRERLEYELWGDLLPDSDILRTHIYTLRNLIDRPFGTEQLITVPRQGYRLDEENKDVETIAT